jgi:hypothetical protein
MAEGHDWRCRGFTLHSEGVNSNEQFLGVSYVIELGNRRGSFSTY